ncbi:MAG: radical SAM protein [Bacteroidales bacterium]|nr:radical SAM protein [Bacteroidales bacterium]
MKHASIPIFIPMQGCLFDCVYCNQHHVTGQTVELRDQEIRQIIENHLETLSVKDSRIEIAFFGGSFTALPRDRQRHYLELVRPCLEHNRVDGIRLSTRPDYIDSATLCMLQEYGVQTIELGVQSMDDRVLELSGRGHTAEDVRLAAALIKDSGFSLALQMMPGLPGDTLEKSMHTAAEIIALGAEATRIYPTLVIRNTRLAELYRNNTYSPLTLDEAVLWCSLIVPVFEKAGVHILRLGLHPSDGLLHGHEMLAGPFHVAFGELVYSEIWHNIFMEITPDQSKGVAIAVHPRQLNHAIGHKSKNKNMLREKFRSVRFETDHSLSSRNFTISYY